MAPEFGSSGVVESTIRQFAVGNVVSVKDKVYKVVEWCDSTPGDSYATYGLRILDRSSGAPKHEYKTTGSLLIARCQEMAYIGTGESEFKTDPREILELIARFSKSGVAQKAPVTASVNAPPITAKKWNHDPLPFRLLLPLTHPVASFERKKCSD